jgi:hypothetical protein
MGGFLSLCCGESDLDEVHEGLINEGWSDTFSVGIPVTIIEGPMSRRESTVSTE